MREENPYATPKADVAAELVGNAALSSFEFKTLQKLYYRSCNVNAITFFIGLGLASILVVFFISLGEIGSGFILVFIGLVIFFTLTVVSLYKRKSWGRVLGIIASIMSLLNFPLGTLIGVFGLFAFIGAPQLFGVNRIEHKALKAEFKLQKLKRKTQKKQIKRK